jgi:hypothetical protein
MFAIHYHKQTGELRQWGDDDGATESVFGPDYEIILFDEWQMIDALRDRIDVAKLTIVRRTRAERAEVMRLAVTNAMADELAATDKFMMQDRPMPTEQREAWRAYRQAVRDLSGSVEHILTTWPKRPDGVDAMYFLRDRLGD